MALGELIQLTFDKIMQTHAYTLVILGTPEKKFAIYLDPQMGKTMQLYLTEGARPRPLTHELVTSILKGFQIEVKQVVIVDLQDTTFFARLFLEQPMSKEMTHIVEVDARPSDCLTLALLSDVPVYCTREVLNTVIPLEE